MKFYPLAEQVQDESVLGDAYRTGRAVGVIRLSDEFFFFRAKRKTYYIAYRDITRIFRRVMLVPARMCCGRGNLSVENLVICGADERELAQIQLPGDRAAKALVEELKQMTCDVVQHVLSDGTRKMSYDTTQ